MTTSINEILTKILLNEETIKNYSNDTSQNLKALPGYYYYNEFIGDPVKQQKYASDRLKQVVDNPELFKKMRKRFDEKILVMIIILNNYLIKKMLNHQNNMKIKNYYLKQV